jgi:Holliday junction resolvase
MQEGRGVYNMAVNSREKGKTGEREFARICREHGYEARRSQQYAGGVDSADVTGLPGIHVEVKFQKTITEGDKVKFIRQAIRDSAGSDNMPIVAHKENYGKWFVTMEMQDFAQMYAIATDSTIIIDGVTQDIYTVTMTVEAWFAVYHEYESSLWIEKKREFKEQEDFT